MIIVWTYIVCPGMEIIELSQASGIWVTPADFAVPKASR